MKQWIVLLVATLTTLSLAITSFALTKPEKGSVARRHGDTADLETPMQVKLKIPRGKVVSVDHGSGTLTVENNGWLRAP